MQVPREETTTAFMHYDRTSLQRAILSSPALLWWGVILLSVYAWWMTISNMDLKIAWHGFSPIGYVYQSAYPANFSKNFVGAVEVYDQSAFMQVYKFAYFYLGITPESLLPVIIGFEFAIIAWATYMLSRSLLPGASPIVPTLVVLFVIASWGREMNLARFAAPFFYGLFYNVADALRVFAIVAALRGRLVVSGMLLAASFATHPIMGLIGTVFVFAMLATKPRHLFRMHAVMGCAVFVMLAGSWMFAVTEPSAVSGGSIPEGEWFKLTKLMGGHWYPFDSGVFTREHTREFLPFLSFLLLLMFYIGRAIPLREIDRKVMAGLAATAVLTVIGVVNSVLTPHPMAIKLALHRGSDLIILVGLVYVTNGLWCEVESGYVWRRVVATFILVSPFISHPGYPLLLSILLTSPTWLSVFRRKSDTRDLPVTILSFGIAVLMLMYVVMGISGPWGSNAYTGGASYFRLVRLYGWGLTVPFLALLLLKGEPARRQVRQMVVFALIATGVVFWVQDQRMDTAELARNRDYMEAQVWAGEHTARDSLFMTDPGIFYGWRDYSRRASFGNLREWLYVGWAYTSNVEVYKEGLRRFNEFSINVDEYADRGIAGFGPLMNEVQERYYNLGDEWWLDLARRYGISYFVLAKHRLTRPTRLPVVYENAHFIILSAIGRSQIEAKVIESRRV